MIGAVDALDWAFAEDPTMFLFVRALVGVFFGGVVGYSTDMAADVLSRSLALLRCMGEYVAAGTLFERDEFAGEAHG